MEKVKVRMLDAVAGDPDPNYDLPSFGFPEGSIQTIHPDLAAAWEKSGICIREDL